MNSFTNSSNFDNLFLQTLLGRLQIRPQTPLSPSFNQTLEEILLDTINNISDSESHHDDNENPTKTQLEKEESKLKKEVIKIISSGNTEESLKPNSGQAVSIREHHICLGYHVESGSEYRVWEWHGYIMLFDDENGYNPEYIYGNYFERLRGVIGKKTNVLDMEEKAVNSGLKDLIRSGEDYGSGRILHRNMSAGSPRV